MFLGFCQLEAQQCAAKIQIQSREEFKVFRTVYSKKCMNTAANITPHSEFSEQIFFLIIISVFDSVVLKSGYF